MPLLQIILPRIKVFPKILFFAIFGLLALILDFFLFAFSGNCSGCLSFSQWLSSPASLSAPFLAAILTSLSLQGSLLDKEEF